MYDYSEETSKILHISSILMICVGVIEKKKPNHPCFTHGIENLERASL